MSNRNIAGRDDNTEEKDDLRYKDQVRSFSEEPPRRLRDAFPVEEVVEHSNDSLEVVEAGSTPVVVAIPTPIRDDDVEEDKSILKERKRNELVRERLDLLKEERRLLQEQEQVTARAGLVNNMPATGMQRGRAQSAVSGTDEEEAAATSYTKQLNWSIILSAVVLFGGVCVLISVLVLSKSIRGGRDEATAPEGTKAVVPTE